MVSNKNVLLEGSGTSKRGAGRCKCKLTPSHHPLAISRLLGGISRDQRRICCTPSIANFPGHWSSAHIACVSPQAFTASTSAKSYTSCLGRRLRFGGRFFSSKRWACLWKNTYMFGLKVRPKCIPIILHTSRRSSSIVMRSASGLDIKLFSAAIICCDFSLRRASRTHVFFIFFCCAPTPCTNAMSFSGSTGTSCIIMIDGSRPAGFGKVSRSTRIITSTASAFLAALTGNTSSIAFFCEICHYCAVSGFWVFEDMCQQHICQFGLLLLVKGCSQCVSRQQTLDRRVGLT